MPEIDEQDDGGIRLNFWRAIGTLTFLGVVLFGSAIAILFANDIMRS